MREIKFRAWLGGVMHPVWLRIDDGVYKTHPDIVIMQYTGLKDKNGKEIYEGDIINSFIEEHNTTDDGKPLHVVQYIKYNPSKAAYDIWEMFNNDVHSVYEEEFTDGDLTIENVTDLAVLGNIYENPELSPPSE